MNLTVTNFDFLNDYRIKIWFSDGTFQVIDFRDFLFSTNHETFVHYRKPTNFKKAQIDNGKLVWGKNWDLVFPTQQLHKGELLPRSTDTDVCMGSTK